MLHPRSLARCAILLAALLLAESSSLFAPAGASSHTGYVEHGPVACVNGAIVSEYNGQTYDTSGITGSGTLERPYNLSGIQIDLTKYKNHEAGVLLLNCDNFRIWSIQTYGDIHRNPGCSGGSSVQPTEVADYGIRVVDSTNVVINNSVLKYGYYAGVSFENSEGQVRRSDIKANFGSGVRLLSDSTVNLTENYIVYNAYFEHSNRAGVYVRGNSNVEMFNNTVHSNVNSVVVDKFTEKYSTGTFNLNDLGPSYGMVIWVVQHQEAGWEPWMLTSCSS